MSDGWHFIDEYYEFYKDRAYTKHQIDSYDAFVRDSMKKLVAAMNPIPVMVANNLTVWVGGRSGEEIFIAPPRFHPQQCRLDDQTYACDVTVNLTFTYETKGSNDRVVIQETNVPDVPFFALPVMVKSQLCTLTGKSASQVREWGEDTMDPGGYFIVQGLEKVVVSQERNAPNRLFVRDSKDPKFSHIATLRSVSDTDVSDATTVFPRIVNFAVYSNNGFRKNAIAISLSSFKEPIPLFVMFRALGITSDYDIMQHIAGDLDSKHNTSVVEFLHSSAVDGNFLFTQVEALEYLGHMMKDKSLHLTEAHRKHDIILLQLATDMFPVTGADLRSKALYLGDVVEQLVRTCVGSLPQLDRDNLRYKRVDVSGTMLTELFRDLYAFYRRHAQSTLESSYNYNFKGQDTSKLITPATITRAFDASIMNSNLLASLKGNWQVFKSPMEMGAPLLGVSQDLSRVTMMGTMSHLRRVSTPIADTATKMLGPHRVQGSHWGMFCPTESPDGANIGLLKHLAVLAHISPDCGQSGIRKLIASKVDDIDETSLSRSHEVSRVRINGVWRANCKDPRDLVEWVKLHRRNGLISPYVSVSWNILSREVLINTDAGRCCRPLLRVEKGKLPEDPKSGRWPDFLHGSLVNQDWNPDTVAGYSPAVVPPGGSLLELLQKNQGVIEFIDAEECECCLIASSRDALEDASKPYSHCEIHASTILSTITSLLPFADHNGAARNVLSCAQTKQGIGIYAMNFRHRLDNTAYVLHYPQRPIVTTRQYAYQQQDIRGHGENAIVAVLAYTGYNQEDAVIINKSSVERGLLSMTYYKTLQVRETFDMGGANRVNIGNPLSKIAGGMAFENKPIRDMDGIDDDGLPKVGTLVHEGDVLIGLFDTVTSQVKDPNWERTNTVVTHTDRSLLASVDGIVDTVRTFQHDAKNKRNTCKIRLREVRPPTVGSKQGGRNSQKGIVSILIPEHEMPYTRSGMVPDIIVHPAGFPKRMTVNQLIEGVMCNLGCMVGAPVDSTAFDPLDLESAFDTLEGFEMNRHGEEIMYNPNTGQQINAQVMITPLYTQAFKHMVQDKMFSRGRGPSVALTRQPTRGRSAGGGLRIGEMEEQSILAHGMHGFLKESMMQRSDGWKFGLDTRGQFIPPDDVSRSGLVTMPYSFKLLTQEVQSLGIGVHIETGDVEESDVDYDEMDLSSESDEALDAYTRVI